MFGFGKKKPAKKSSARKAAPARRSTTGAKAAPARRAQASGRSLTRTQQQLRSGVLAAARRHDLAAVQRISDRATSTDRRAVINALSGELTDELLRDIRRAIG